MAARNVSTLKNRTLKVMSSREFALLTPMETEEKIPLTLDAMEHLAAIRKGLAMLPAKDPLVAGLTADLRELEEKLCFVLFDEQPKRLAALPKQRHRLAA
jgi:hypothetical protein